MYQRVQLTHNMVNRLFCLSRKLMDLAVVYGHVVCWVAAKPYDDGELTVICVVNWTENEQNWKSVQLVSTATVLICKLFM